MRVSLVLLGVSGWLVALAALAFPAAAQSPLYVDCATVTVSPSPYMERGTPTATTIALQNPSPSPTLNGIFQTATWAAALYTTPSPEFISTPIGAAYSVVTARGVNVRAAASVQAGIISSLYPGQVVSILEITPDYHDNYKWGRLASGGWVAMVSIWGDVLLRAG